ncbi:MAG: SWIM zinc finger family protein [Desertimonas sp.]
MAAVRWSIEQVMALTPAPARFAAAEPLAIPGQWGSLGADDRAAWGRCRGSGREPYDTVVDHATVGWRCSCPSRAQPCKHVLALLILWVRGHVPISEAPAGVGRWLSRRGGLKRTDASPEVPIAEVPIAEAPGEHGPIEDRDQAAPNPDGPPDLERGRDDRIARLLDGLVELDRWVLDRLRTGLADPALARYATWDQLAARLVDARAGALANRVRRLAGVVGTRADWHEVVLAELGIWHLLAQGAHRVSDLPSPLADGVATACGWQVRHADVLAGVPDTDTWRVMARSDTREDRIEVRRLWLRGRRGGWAMLLSFAAYRQALDVSLSVGDELAADLHRYPGGSVRALLGTVADPAGVAVGPPDDALDLDAACAAIGRWYAEEPWADRVPVTVRAAVTLVEGRWVLVDHTGSLALAPDAPGVDAVVAAAASDDELVLTVEWTLDGVVPLTIHLEDRDLDIGPVADPSFVSAA